MEKIGRFRRVNALGIREVEPWPEVVDGKELLDELADVVTRFVVLPRHAAQTLALWVVHTYAFELRDVASYIGIESPEKRCGKTTLLAVLSELVCRPVVAANISSPAFFRVIEELRPTLLIDEADTFLRGDEELKGILNSGYARSTAFVVRVSNEIVNHKGREGKETRTSNIQLPTSNIERGEDEEGGNRKSKIEDRKEEGTTQRVSTNCFNAPLIADADRPYQEGGSRLASFSCWCPKVMAAIGRLPDTLSDRCIVIRMQRKSVGESCERLRNLEAETLRRKCARFVLDHRDAIALARPEVPEELNDRAADIWEPLFAIADLVNHQAYRQEHQGEARAHADGHGLFTEDSEGNEEGETRTFNVQHPTSNIERGQDEEGGNRKSNIDNRKESEGGGDGKWNMEHGKGWGPMAREAAVCLTGIAQENNPIGSLLMDILYCFSIGRAERLFSRTLVQQLNCMSGRPWNEMTRRKTKDAPQGVTEVWLSRVLRNYGVRPATMRIGEAVAKGYSMEDFTPVFKRYIPMSEVDDMKARLSGKSPEQVEREERARELEERRKKQMEAFAQVNELATIAGELSGNGRLRN